MQLKCSFSAGEWRQGIAEEEEADYFAELGVMAGQFQAFFDDFFLEWYLLLTIPLASNDLADGVEVEIKGHHIRTVRCGSTLASYDDRIDSRSQVLI